MKSLSKPSGLREALQSGTFLDDIGTAGRDYSGKLRAIEVAEPLTMTILEAAGLPGLSRSEIYRRLGDRSLRAVKSGSRTLIVMESLRTYFAGLPEATIRTPTAVWK
jgi:excisionase family DNA binding protein